MPATKESEVSGANSPSIIDIRRAAVETNLKDEILSQWNSSDGARTLPTLLLYNEKGLQIFEDITYLDEYYLTNNEIKALKESSKEIAENILSGSMVIELGSGNLRKVCLLLQAFEDAGKQVDYYALDLSREELERTLAQVPDFKHVRCHGLWGTYDDGQAWLKSEEIRARPKCILSLGSSIGNFERDDAAAFLKSFGDVLQPSDSMLIGVDSCSDPAKVYHAYNDKQGITHRFILNGLANANEILGEEAFKLDDWKVIGEFVYDEEGGRHQAFYSPIRETTALGTVVKPHERIRVEESLKYSALGAKKLWNAAGMAEIRRWYGNEHGLHFLVKPKMPFDLSPETYATGHLPTLEEWAALWSTWDLTTKGMLPREDLHDKPIKLRNACIFYLGHIPTFLDIQLTKVTKEPPTEPAFYHDIFERGIDPDVDNPEQCHDHSEIPDEWPPAGEIAEYQHRVRSRVRDLYKDGADAIPRGVARAIWIGFEHEVMHLETLLYMMLQSDRTLPPPHTERPDFEKMAQEAKASRVENEWHDVPQQSIRVGMDDPEDKTEGKGYFGWDNEKPSRRVQVAAFQAKGRPITNEEYAQYLYHSHIDKIPASWTIVDSSAVAPQANGHANGNGCHGDDNMALPTSYIEAFAVRTVYGPVPLKHALDWPVFASYDEISRCASWMGGRIPTYEEAQAAYNYVDRLKKKEAERKLGRTVPAVNGHLCNDGVEESPPSADKPCPPIDGVAGPGGREALFVDLKGANVGFQHWHPVPVTAHGDRLAGQAELGGVWEWTSSALEKHDGFEPMAMYPGYTADFFDGKHNIVLGGSWATHPRIAGRKSFVNWYQRNYLYAWCGARIVRDGSALDNGAEALAN